MFNKLYFKLMNFLKENAGFLFGLILFYCIINIPLPYYIHTDGGLIDIADKVSIEGEYTQEGSLNLTYVSEIRGNVITYLVSFFMPNWDLVGSDEVRSKNETYSEVTYRNQMFLEDANQNAVRLAYETAGHYLNIISQRHYIVYVDELAKTDLKIKDEIISVNGADISSMEEYVEIVQDSNLGDVLTLKVKLANGTEKIKYIEVIEYNGNKVTGIYFISKYSYIASPKITFNFKESESGSSGGLMMALSIYNKLTEEDITKGNKIVGTGTIDVYGNVGEISGIEYKLKGADKNNAKVFLVPNGANYEKALLVKEEYKYNITIVGVSTFSDAINYLKNL